MQYRGYTIETDSLWGYTFAHRDYDGAEDSQDGRCGAYETLRECLNWIDDYIADYVFCEACGSSGKVSTEDAKYCDDCPHCHDAREIIGLDIYYPETCVECSGKMTELFPGSGKEQMRCLKCETAKVS
jgi:hypothetical protein